MHTKIAVHSSSCKNRRLDKLISSSRKLSHSDDRINEALKSSEEINIFDDSWLEEEETKRDHPLIKRLCNSIKKFLQHSEAGILLSYCPGLPMRISEEIARISRDEPGGLSAGRFQLNIATNESFLKFADTFDLNAESKPTSLTLGSASLSEARMVETFEVQIYLFPSNSVLSKLQSIISTLRQKDDSRRNSRPRNISLLPDFVLTKHKLFRSNNNKPFIVVKSIAK